MTKQVSAELVTLIEESIRRAKERGYAPPYVLQTAFDLEYSHPDIRINVDPILPTDTLYLTMKERP
jgi:hypothetical protein